MQTANREAPPRDVDSNPIFQDGDLIYDGVVVREIPEIAGFNNTAALDRRCIPVHASEDRDMRAKPLLLQQPVTAKGDAPSQDLVQVIQQLCRIIDTLTPLIETIHGEGGVLERLDNLTARVEALEP